MKKIKAVNLAELIIAMGLVSVLGVIGINTLKIFVKNDTDIAKFKNVLGTVSLAISQMSNDVVMYPDMNGFKNTSTQYYPNDPDHTFKGTTKFRRLFRRKFNINNTDIFSNILDNKNNFSSPIYVEYSKDVNPSYTKAENITFEKLKDLECYSDNKGITYCPPRTTSKSDYIYLLVFLNSINQNKPETYDIAKAVYFKIRYDGKLSVPPQIPLDNSGNFLIDCINRGSNAEYAQCKARDRFSDIDLIQQHN